jgi:Tfp pilus assembly protein PilV
MTLVEMLVAVVILSVGLLGLVGTAGIVTRQVGGGAKQSLVAQILANRLETLRSLGCTRIGDSGTSTTRGITESWVKGATVNQVLSVTTTITYRLAGNDAKTETYVLTVPCQ